MVPRQLTRRATLRAGASALAVGLAGCQDEGDGPAGTRTGGGDGPTASPGGDAGPAPPSGLSVRATQVASGFTAPVAVESPGGGRRFVADQTGEIYVHDDAGLREEPYLDLSERLVELRSSFDERGLLGLAFHPEFADEGRFFVRYSSPPREATPGAYSHTFVLSEFRAAPGADRADPGTERAVLEIPQPQFNHNAGAIAFGPDGYLYVGVGDGGGSNDAGEGHVEDWYDDVEGGNGQDVTENLLGSVLRIDVDGENGGQSYGIPRDNPLVGEEGLEEHYAWGFRNPWRMSFGPDGRLFVADVGENDREEVDVVEPGGNYGWNVREGTRCFGAESCPSETRDGDPLLDPIIEYPTGGGAPVSGAAVIGGYLYDGDEIPDLRGRYVFADWLAEGRLFVAEESEEGLWPTAVLSVEADGAFGPNVLSFGRDPAGELLVCTSAERGVAGESGAVYRLESG